MPFLFLRVVFQSLIRVRYGDKFGETGVFEFLHLSGFNFEKTDTNPLIISLT